MKIFGKRSVVILGDALSKSGVRFHSGQMLEFPLGSESSLSVNKFNFYKQFGVIVSLSYKILP